MSDHFTEANNSGGVSYVLQGASKLNPQAPSMGVSFLSNNLFAPTALLPLNTSCLIWPGTFDGTTLKIFVNGTQIASQAQTGSIATSTQPLAVGGNWQGLIDEIRIYNRALAGPQKIQTDMNTSVVTLGSVPLSPTGLRFISN